MVTPTEDGLFWCLANETNRDEERDCGKEGREACLNTATGVYACASPAPDGAAIRAVPAGPDPATATHMCLRCGIAGSRACVCNEPPCPDHGGTAWCSPGLEVSNLDGLAYCQEAAKVGFDLREDEEGSGAMPVAAHEHQQLEEVTTGDAAKKDEHAARAAARAGK